MACLTKNPELNCDKMLFYYGELGSHQADGIGHNYKLQVIEIVISVLVSGEFCDGSKSEIAMLVH